MTLRLRSLLTTLTMITLAVLGVTSTYADSAEATAEWTQWRGPDRDGHAPMFEAPAEWPEALEEVWRIEVGEGYASPVVSDGVIYLMARQGENEVAMALDLVTGKTRWTSGFATPYTMHQAAVKYGKGPKSTPIIADGVVCFLGIDARFTCHEAATGRTLWTRDFSDRSSPQETFCGSAMSPLVVDGVIYVHLGDDLAGRFFAADLRTGKEKWSWEGQGPGYASPLWLEIDGVPQVVTFATTDLLSFDPQTGELLWNRHYPDKWKENIPTPLVVGERIIIADFENGTLSLWPRKTSDGWVVDDQWHNRDLTQRMASPVTDGERVYGFSDRRKGHLFALNPATGQVLWEGRGRGGSNAVLTVAGEWLLVTTTNADLKVMRWEGDALKVAANYEIAPSEVWAHPAWLSDGVLVKDLRHLTRFRVTAEAASPPDTSKANETSVSD